MNQNETLKQIITRTSGEIYLGVVGPVRSGKSTFIKKFVETLILPNITDDVEKNRIIDELPQSSDGKTIMTMEPKFVPSTAANVQYDDELAVKLRLVDCVGYVTPNAKGYSDENGPRLVKTPWYDEAIPFVEAAEVGTRKVIEDHSTVGVVMTSDGSIGTLDRGDYEEVEGTIVEQLQAINKPFIMILNSVHPMKDETEELRSKLSDRYGIPVLALSVEHLSNRDMMRVFREALYEFEVNDLDIRIPNWIHELDDQHHVKEEIMSLIKSGSESYKKLKEVELLNDLLQESELIESATVTNIDPSSGDVEITITCDDDLYQYIIRSIVGDDIDDKGRFIRLLQNYSVAKRQYDEIRDGLAMVEQTGYGIVSPSVENMSLAEPEIIKQGARFGVKLKAVAPSIHLVKVDVESVFEPIIGTEQQSRELINYIMKDYEQEPLSIWNSEIFGRKLSNIVNDGINAKLHIMPDKARTKLQETLHKIVNNNSGGMLTILL